MRYEQLSKPRPIMRCETPVIRWQRLLTCTCKITYREEGEDNDIGAGEVLHRKACAIGRVAEEKETGKYY